MGVDYVGPTRNDDESKQTTWTRHNAMEVQLKNVTENKEPIKVETVDQHRKSVDCLLKIAIDGNHTLHQANVCVICDALIIGTAKVCAI